MAKGLTGASFSSLRASACKREVPITGTFDLGKPLREEL
jgi:hypothetical protein